MSDALLALLRADLRDLKGSPIRTMLAMAREPDMVSLAGGHPDPELIPVAWAQDAAREVLQTLDGLSLQYGATEGLPALRESAAVLLAERGLGLLPQDVVITTGSQQALSLLADILVEPGDAVAMAAFNYPAAMQTFRFCGARLLRCDDDLSDLRAVVRGHGPGRVKALYVVPNYANPTGHLMPLPARVELLRMAAELGICVIEDDAYGELWFNEEPPLSLYALNQRHGLGAAVCHAASFSKILLPGLRLGVLAAPPALLRTLVIAKQFRDVHSGLMEQMIVDRMLRSGRLDAHLPRLRAGYRIKAESMVASLGAAQDQISFERPAGGMFCWVRLKGGRASTDEVDWFEFGRRHRVLVLPDAAFATDGAAGDRLRLSFANQPPLAIATGIRRLLIGLSS